MSTEVAEMIHTKMERVDSLKVRNDVKLYHISSAFCTSLNSLLCFSMAALFSAQMFILKLSSSLNSPSPALASEVVG